MRLLLSLRSRICILAVHNVLTKTKPKQKKIQAKESNKHVAKDKVGYGVRAKDQ